MRMSWRTWVMIVLIATWPQLGCHQMAADKAVQEPRPIQKPVGDPQKQDLTAADITHAAWFARIDTLEKTGKTQEAIELCEKMREPGNPQATIATRKLAALYHRMDKLDEAEQEYQRLRQQNPKDADVLAKLGDIAYARKHFNLADKHYSDAITHRPDHAFALTGLGMVAAQLGEYQRSFEAFNKVLPSRAEAYCQVAYFLSLQGKTSDAIRAYEAAINIEPRMPRANQELTKLRQGRTVAVTSAKVGQQGMVELEPSTAIDIGGTNRTMMQRPVLTPVRNVETAQDPK